MHVKTSEGTVAPFMSWLTHNETVLAITIICTLATGAVLLFQAARWLRRFLVDAYHTSFLTALKRVRAGLQLWVILSTSDIHVFFALIIYFSCFAAICVLVGLLVLSTLSTGIGKGLDTALVSSAVIIGASGVFYIAAVMFLTLRVARRRIRKLRRERRVRLMTIRALRQPGTTGN
jgi:hypothetical protein